MASRRLAYLEVQANTWQIDQRLDANLSQLLWVTDTRSLKDERGAKGAASDDDLLPRPEDSSLFRLAVNLLGWNSRYANGHTVLDDDLVNLCVDLQVKILVLGSSGMNVSGCCIRPAATVSVDPFEPLFSTVASNKILKIICDRESLTLRCPQEVLHDGVLVVAERNLDRPFKAVEISVVAGSLVCLVLLHQRNELLCRPALGLKVVVVRSRSTGVHHEVD